MMTSTKRVISGILWMARGTATMMGLAVMLALTVGLASTALAGTGIGARFDLGKTNAVNAASRLIGSSDGPMLAITNQSDGTNTQRAAAPPPPGPSPIPEPPPAVSPAPALGLAVQPGQPPLTVNPEAGTAKHLSADELDGRDSSSFARATGGKADYADRLDGKDSSQFLGVASKAFDSDRLDGRDSTAFFSGKTYQNSDTLFAQPGDQEHHAEVSCDPGDVAVGGGHGFAGTNSVVDMGSGTTKDKYFVNYKGVNQVLMQVTCADFPPLR